MAGKRETRAIGLADGSGGASIRKDAVNPREVIELGAEALSVVRNTLAMRYRFLDRALWKMPMVPTPLVNIASETLGALACGLLGGRLLRRHL